MRHLNTRVMKRVVSDAVLCKHCGQYIKPFTEEWVHYDGKINIYGCYSGYCRDCIEDYLDPVNGKITEERFPLLSPELESSSRFKRYLADEEFVWQHRVDAYESECKNEEWTKHDEKMQEALSAWEVREGIIGATKRTATL